MREIQHETTPIEDETAPRRSLSVTSIDLDKFKRYLRVGCASARTAPVYEPRHSCFSWFLSCFSRSQLPRMERRPSKQISEYEWTPKLDAKRLLRSSSKFSARSNGAKK